MDKQQSILYFEKMSYGEESTGRETDDLSCEGSVGVTYDLALKDEDVFRKQRARKAF